MEEISALARDRFVCSLFVSTFKRLLLLLVACGCVHCLCVCVVCMVFVHVCVVFVCVCVCIVVCFECLEEYWHENDV